MNILYHRIYVRTTCINSLASRIKEIKVYSCLFICAAIVTIAKSRLRDTRLFATHKHSGISIILGTQEQMRESEPPRI